MRARPLPLGLLCATVAFSSAVLGSGSLTPATAADPEETVTPVRIMLGGDSITQGFDGDYTWRYRLYKEFQRQGKSVNFVGPRKYTYGGAERYLVNSGWDTDHDATGGTRLKTQIDEIVSDMAAAQPDVLVALYGTTDLLPRPAGDSNPTVPLAEEIDDLREYILRVREVNADIDIVLGEVTTRRIPNRQAFNDAVNALAAEENNNWMYPDSRVAVADMDYVGWDPTKNTYDSTHPTPVGEAIIAQRIAWVLKKFGQLPQNPGISSAGLTWAPPWAPSIRVSTTRRIVTNWAATKFQYKPQMMRIWIKDLRTGKAGTSGWTTASQYVSSAKRPGRFQIRIQGRRQAMISPWSKTWTVTVRR